MKKIFGLLALFVAIVGFNDVSADEIVKNVVVSCGGVTNQLNVNGYASFKTRTNTCDVSVDIANGYQIVTENYNTVTLNEGDNTYSLVVKDANEKTYTYNYLIKYKSYTSTGATGGNPDTGDYTLVYVGAGVATLAIACISLNKMKKYSEVE